VDALVDHIQQVFGQAERFLGYETVPWLLLLAILVIRPPALGGLLHLRKTWHASRYGHLLNLTRFRMALVKRDSAKSNAAGRAIDERLP
jgi:hypothetical protein